MQSPSTFFRHFVACRGVGVEFLDETPHGLRNAANDAHRHNDELSSICRHEVIQVSALARKFREGWSEDLRSCTLAQEVYLPTQILFLTFSLIFVFCSRQKQALCVACFAFCFRVFMFLYETWHTSDEEVDLRRPSFALGMKV